VSRNLKRNTVLETVLAIVQDLIQDWGIDAAEAAGADTLLAEGLQFTSVDIIQLCVALEECYDRRFGFHDLLMKDGSYVGDLSLGRLADFVAEQLLLRADTPTPTQEAVTS
jgi:acyl carrier protein